MPAVDIDREAAHEAAQRELSKPMYPNASLTDRLSEWLDELLYKVMLKGSAFPGGWLTITVLAILLIVAVVVGVRIARRTMRTRRGDSRAIFGAHILSAAQHRAIADDHAMRGDWAGAIRHRLRAVARQLEETDVLGAIPGRTANELARDAGSSMPDLAGDFNAAATIFNDVTYGEQPGSETGYRHIAQLDGRLQHHSASQHRSANAPLHVDDWTAVR
jgi:hypothetical protein